MSGTSASRRQRQIQDTVRATDKRHRKQQPTPMQAGARRYAVPPLPKQHQRKPGLEAKLDPAPMCDAPFYIGSQKLEGRVYLPSYITGEILPIIGGYNDG